MPTLYIQYISMYKVDISLPSYDFIHQINNNKSPSVVTQVYTVLVKKIKKINKTACWVQRGGQLHLAFKESKS